MERRHVGASRAPRPREVVAACALGLALAAGPARGDVVLASNLPPGFELSIYNIGIGFSGGRFANESAAQQFTPQTSGTLTTIDASIDQVTPAGVPVTVSVYTASGSAPGARLGSMTFQPGQVSTNVYKQLSTFDLSSAKIQLNAGTSYFITYTVATPVNGNDRYRVILLENTPTSVQPLFSTNGVSAWQPEGIAYEIGLTVHGITAQASVPEPGALALAAAGALTVLAGFALRRRSAR